MAELIHVHSARVSDDDRTIYVASTYGEQRSDDTWAGWIEFRPVDGGTAVLRTDQETSQPNREALDYWASGLEPIYLEGALSRARRHTASHGTRHATAGGEPSDDRPRA